MAKNFDGGLVAHHSCMQQAPWAPSDLAGHLEKLGHADHKWRRRFFALKGQQLFYFRSSSSSKPLGVVALNGAAVTAVRPAGRHSSNTLQHHILELQLDSSLRNRNKHAAYKLAAASLELQELWHDALQSAAVTAGRPSSLASMAMMNPGLAVLAAHDGLAAGDASTQQLGGVHLLTYADMHPGDSVQENKPSHVQAVGEVPHSVSHSRRGSTLRHKHSSIDSSVINAGGGRQLERELEKQQHAAALYGIYDDAQHDTAQFEQDELLVAGSPAEPMQQAKRSSRKTVAASRGRASGQSQVLTGNNSDPSNVPRHSSTGPVPLQSTAADDLLTYGKHTQPPEFKSRKSFQSMSAAACQDESDSDNQSHALARRSARATPLSHQFEPAEFKGWHPEAASVTQQADIKHQPQQMPPPHRRSQASQHFPAHHDEGGIPASHHGVQVDVESIAEEAEGSQSSGENDDGGGFKGLQASNRSMSVSQHTSSRKLSGDSSFAAATRKSSVVAEGNRTGQYFRSSSSSVGSSNRWQLRARRHNERSFAQWCCWLISTMSSGSSSSDDSDSSLSSISFGSQGDSTRLSARYNTVRTVAQAPRRSISTSRRGSTSSISFAFPSGATSNTSDPFQLGRTSGTAGADRGLWRHSSKRISTFSHCNSLNIAAQRRSGASHLTYHTDDSQQHAQLPVSDDDRQSQQDFQRSALPATSSRPSTAPAARTSLHSPGWQQSIDSRALAAASASDGEVGPSSTGGLDRSSTRVLSLQQQQQQQMQLQKQEGMLSRLSYRTMMQMGRDAGSVSSSRSSSRRSSLVPQASGSISTGLTPPAASAMAGGLPGPSYRINFDDDQLINAAGLSSTGSSRRSSVSIDGGRMAAGAGAAAGVLSARKSRLYAAANTAEAAELPAARRSPSPHSTRTSSMPSTQHTGRFSALAASAADHHDNLLADSCTQPASASHIAASSRRTPEHVGAVLPQPGHMTSRWQVNQAAQQQPLSPARPSLLQLQQQMHHTFASSAAVFKQQTAAAMIEHQQSKRGAPSSFEVPARQPQSSGTLVAAASEPHRVPAGSGMSVKPSVASPGLYQRQMGSRISTANASSKMSQQLSSCEEPHGDVGSGAAGQPLPQYDRQPEMVLMPQASRSHVRSSQARISVVSAVQTLLHNSGSGGAEQQHQQRNHQRHQQDRQGLLVHEADESSQLLYDSLQHQMLQQVQWPIEEDEIAVEGLEADEFAEADSVGSRSSTGLGEGVPNSWLHEGPATMMPAKLTASAGGLAEGAQSSDGEESHAQAHLLQVNVSDGRAAHSPANFSALGAEALWGSGTGGAGAAVEAVQAQDVEEQQLGMLGVVNSPRSSRSSHRRHLSTGDMRPSQPHEVGASTTQASSTALTSRTSGPGASSLMPDISQGVLDNSNDPTGGGSSSKQMTRQRAATDFQPAGLPRAASRSTVGPPTALRGQQGSLARAVQPTERQQSLAGRQSRLLGGSLQATALSETAAAVGLPATAAQWWRRQSVQAVQGVMGLDPEAVDEYEAIQTGQDSQLFMGSDTQPAAIDEGAAVFQPEDDLRVQPMLNSQQLVSGHGRHARPPSSMKVSLLTAAAVGRGSMLHTGLGVLGEAAGEPHQAEVQASKSFEEATAAEIGGLISRPTLTTHATASAMPTSAAAADDLTFQGSISASRQVSRPGGGTHSRHTSTTGPVESSTSGSGGLLQGAAFALAAYDDISRQLRSQALQQRQQQQQQLDGWHVPPQQQDLVPMLLQQQHSEQHEQQQQQQLQDCQLQAVGDWQIEQQQSGLTSMDQSCLAVRPHQQEQHHKTYDEWGALAVPMNAGERLSIAGNGSQLLQGSAQHLHSSSAEVATAHENRTEGAAALPVLEDGSRLDEVAVALRGVQQSMVALQQQLLGAGFGPEDPEGNLDKSRPGVAVRCGPDEAAKVAAVMDIADARLSMQEQRHGQALVKAAADVQRLAHRPSASGAPGSQAATRPEVRPPPAAPPLPTALAASLGSKQGAGGPLSRPATSKPMAPPLPPPVQLHPMSTSAATATREEGGTRFAAQARPAFQNDLNSTASGDRSALLQAIHAGAKLKHIQRTSMAPQQLQAQPLQQVVLNNRNASSPVAGPAEPANTAFLKAIQ